MAATIMAFRRWLPILLYLLCLCYFLVQLFSAWHQLPPRIVIGSHPGGRPDDVGYANAFVIFLAAASLFAPLPFAGTFWRLRSMDPDSIKILRTNYWQRPENWRCGCDSLFFTSFWLASATLVYLVGWFLLVVQANQRQPPSLDVGSLHTLWLCCSAVALTWVFYAVWFVYRTPPDL